MLVAPALAQKTTGDITGSVVDSTGAVLPGVTVTATCPATNFARTVTTDAQGGFSIPELPICVYKVSAELPGFKTISRDTQVSVNTVTKADFKLEVGTQSDECGVKGGAAINVVMKAGTNQVHGTGYYFRHDNWTDSPNFFVKRGGGETTDVKNQQYGGTFGGPIVKDKTFFFGYYEGQRLSFAAPYDVLLPRPSEIAAARGRIAAAGLTVNPIGENLLKYYPTAESGRQTI